MGTSNLADKENGYTKLKGLQYKMLKVGVVFLVVASFWQMSAATPVGTKTAAAVAGAAIGITIDGNDATDCNDVESLIVRRRCKLELGCGQRPCYRSSPGPRHR